MFTGDPQVAIQGQVVQSGRPHSLRGRRAECATLDQLLADIRQGTGRALVLQGEVGIGKTALLEYLTESAADFEIVRAAGVESEMQLGYAGLHQLCAPLLGRLESLPGPQRNALQTAFGLNGGEPPDRFRVGLGVLNLFARAAAKRPLLCVVDDAQWLHETSAQTLAFVARRLTPAAIGLVFAAAGPRAEFERLALLEVGGLPEQDARALLASAAGFTLDPRVGSRIIAETRGNPRALLELPRDLIVSQLAGGSGPLGAPPLPTSVERRLAGQLSSLSTEARRLLLLAAAEPIGDPALLLHASAHAGIELSRIDGEAHGVLNIGDRVTFRHRLVRSAVYRSAASDERRSAHLALAHATDPDTDPGWRAWHLACAATAPDEAIAAELERSAGRARGRGGLAAAAALLRRAVGLTPEPSRRVDRALAAAHASLRAGALDAARQLLSSAEVERLDQAQRVRTDLLRAQLAFAERRGGDPPALRLLLEAAQQLASLDPELARESYLDALVAAVAAGRFGEVGGTVKVAEAVRSAPRLHRLSGRGRAPAGRLRANDHGGVRRRRAATATGRERLLGRQHHPRRRAPMGIPRRLRGPVPVGRAVVSQAAGTRTPARG